MAFLVTLILLTTHTYVFHTSSYLWGHQCEPDRLRLLTVTWSVLLEMFMWVCVCIWMPAGTIHPLSSLYTGLSHWWPQLPVVSWQDGEYRRGGESRLVKNGVNWPQCTNTHTRFFFYTSFNVHLKGCQIMKALKLNSGQSCHSAYSTVCTASTCSLNHVDNFSGYYCSYTLK